MMAFYQKIKLIFVRARPFSSVYARHGIQPMRDWRIILICFFIVLSLSALSSFYLYGRVMHGNIFVLSADDSITRTRINQSLFEKSIKEIHEREQETDYLKTNTLWPHDPSVRLSI